MKKFLQVVNKILVKFIEPTQSRMLVRESMILMGFVISDFAIKHKIPLPFRLQKESDISIKSEIINDTNILENSIGLDIYSDNLSVNINANIYE